MKADEYRQLTAGDLSDKLEEAREEHFNLRFQNATGQLENFNQLGRAKRDIARIRTIMRERDLRLDREVGQEKPGSRRTRRSGDAPAGEDTPADQGPADEGGGETMTTTAGATDG